MSIKERLYQAINSIVDVYYYSIPIEHTTYPVGVYHILNEQYSLILDDKDYGKEYYISLDIFSTEDLENIKNSVEQAVKNEFTHCYVRNIRESKEADLFRVIIEFKILGE